MAEATVENQGHGVTSMTSDHIAQNTAPDVCFTPDKSATIPHDNSVNTSAATEHTIDKTQINGGKVVRVGDAIGPASKSGDGGACGKGVASGTCQEEARATTGSPNVTAEGKPVARKTDPTTQNHGNTAGHVTGGDPNDKDDGAVDQKKLACNFKDNEKGKVPDNSMTCVHAAPGGGSSLAGAKVPCGGPGRYAGPDGLLEVTTPVEVKLLSKRINAKKADAPPECEEHNHTKWKVDREKSQFCAARSQEFPSEDTHLLSKDWFAYPAQYEFDSDTDGRNSIAKDRGARRTTPTSARKTRTRARRRHSAKRSGKENRIGTQRRRCGRHHPIGGQAGYEAFRTIKEFLEVWNLYDEPINVIVDADACAGGLKYTIRSFPSQKTSFKIDDKLIAKIRAPSRSSRRSSAARRRSARWVAARSTAK